MAGSVESVRPNLFLNYEGALVGLLKLPRESVDEVLIDLALEEDFTLTKLEIAYSLPRATVSEIRQSDLDPRRKDSLSDLFEFWREQMIKQINRILKPDGVLEINTVKADVPKVNELLDKTGFTHEDRPTTEEEVSKSHYMSGIARCIKEGKEGLDAEKHKITHITAKKKQPKDKEPKLLPAPRNQEK